MFAKKTIKSIIIVMVMLVLSTFNQPSLWAGENKIVTEEVAYYTGHDDIKGYLARPKDAKPAPAIILIHEWWGLTDWIRGNARKFAELGYVALAVDLYNGKSTDDRQKARELMMGVQNNMDEAFSNLKAAVAYLKGKPKWVIKDRMSSIGWCFGGGWSYNMAKNNLGVKASVIYYGYFNPKDDLKKMRAMILGNFGEKDRGISVDNVKEFQVTLKTLSGDHEIYIYENAGHGFARPGGSAYNKEAADLAWKRTVKFLKKHL
ncbi:MAG: dienelactone hydrolase family protein [bacterium]|nr:dienelactone hydrolase family protein [bacterium]